MAAPHQHSTNKALKAVLLCEGQAETSRHCRKDPPHYPAHSDRPGELRRRPLDLRLSHLVAAPTRMAVVCFLLAVFTDTTFLSFPGAVIHEGRTLFLLSDFRVSIAMVFHTQGLASLQQDQKITLLSHRAYLTPVGTDLECLQGGTKSVDSSKPTLFQFTSNNYWSV